MERFTLEEDGLIRDDSVRENLQRLQELFPWVDGLTTEANMAFTKAQATVFSQLTPDLFDMGLSPSRFNCLRALYVAPDRRMSMSEISSWLGVTTPLVTKVVDSLVREGWVVRAPGPVDRRTVYAELTPEGVRRFEERFPVISDRVNDYWVGLDETEKLLLIHLLNKLRLGYLSRSKNLSVQIERPSSAARPDQGPQGG